MSRDIIKEREELLRNIVEYKMVHMTIREVIDCFPDDQCGHLPMPRLIKRARFNLYRSYDEVFTTDGLKKIWDSMGGTHE